MTSCESDAAIGSSATPVERPKDDRQAIARRQPVEKRSAGVAPGPRRTRAASTGATARAPQRLATTANSMTASGKLTTT